MHMFSVECILKKLDNIVTYGIFCGETFGPCKDLARSQSRLFYGERECQSKEYVIRGCCGGVVCRRGIIGGRVRRQKRIYRIGEVI